MHAGWESLSAGEEGVSPWSRSVMAWRSARTDRTKDSLPIAHVSTNRFLGLIHTQRKRTRTSSMVFATTKGLFTRNAEVTVFLTGLKWVQCIPVVMFTHNVKIRQKDQRCR